MTGLEIGVALPPQLYAVTRADLVRYAGASGDLNPIHWSDRVATSVRLPGVVAHGMLTMGLLARALEVWAGGPGRVRQLGCRFVEPLPVPDDDEGALVRIEGTVTALSEGEATVTCEVTSAGVTLLARTRAVIDAGAAATRAAGDG